ncbi:CidA/LrgA family protein [Companilactobacillus sp.]|jgi:holin-like protein|uniref:CidA/LrgA family protein n=1 Tax=Companilactobacillus sp. TaxID=2767905 RepID=UPI0025C39388|nr:CidA/LrgA family protein [Companilactobacillus sp.]MCH4008410.1 CidA/LrgA family protein [Companilactobacillus sp.]MCH4051411.1 CidA/LrgA family protein [Companilactobacillus sp.]MCH4076353.1 CidA/LrgA family protein [Companilactobacillus sp.]MCH4124928.1 CidA/LrgA family protein [Companilactobacillus sp.]MCH4131470.1 CidA/LrgA family protein [Companilactobacillus sp.]
MDDSKRTKANTKEDVKKPSNVLIQIAIFVGVLFVSNILSMLMPKSFPVPAPVWGLLILYFLLTTKIVKVEQVEKMSTFLISIIGFLFVPSGVQLYTHLNIIKEDGVMLIIAIIISTIVLLVVISYTAKFFIFISSKLRNAHTPVITRQVKEGNDANN